MLKPLKVLNALMKFVFFDQELLNNTEYFDDIYTLASTFYNNIPTKNKVILWSKFANEWSNEEY
ncbi:Uncharacterised protein [Sphingobacterium spiritivorum]|uniref:Uncharacterized protein n=1 Tax=Sphingobacterium spiritivorum TaxID=258 RepID=A0A380BUA4_SPHSI|nr:Uncharacterised protein [Sphingobacterium spiritivorum]